MACARGLTDRDRNIRDQVKLYRRLIEEIIDPKQMLSSPEGFTLEQCLGGVNVQQIKKRQVSDGHLSAAQLMFDQLEQCEESGVWTAFDDLLQNAGYKRISSILRGEPVRNENHNTQLIKVIGPTVTHKIDPVVLLPHLLQKALSEEDGQNIHAEATNKGNISATVLLFDALLRSKTRDWFDDFMVALIENQQLNVVNEIDPDFYQEWKKLRSEVSSFTSAEDSSLECDPAQTSLKTAGGNVEEEEMGMSVYYEENNLDRGNLKSANKLLSKDVTGDIQPSSDLPLNVGGEAQEGNTDSAPGEMASCVTAENTTPKQIHVDESNMLDLTSDEEDDVNQEDQLQLRGYQRELARAGLEGKNCVIIAPTGSGKTNVALKIIQEHFSTQETQNRGIKKAVFLVNNVCLAKQHAAACEKILPRLRTKLMFGCNPEQLSLSEMLPVVDVFIMTAQILLDALKNRNQENISVTEFTLIVFDECHHTFNKHPYNAIMFFYLDEKLQENGEAHPLPQIIGLTASVGVGKAKTKEQAKVHIQKLCANLDASEICTVKLTVGELAKHLSVPTEDIMSVKGRGEDKFADFLQDWMDSIWHKIKTKDSKRATLEDPPRSKLDSQEYKQWISETRKKVAILCDSDMRHYCMSCLNFAKICNETLIINHNVRTCDALEYLKNEIDHMDSSRTHEVVKELIKYFRDNLTYMDKVSSSPLAVNPKLEELKKVILRTYEEKADSRGIIFVKTRRLAEALQRWIMDTPDLEWLNPHKLVGQATQSELGMTQNQQRDVLEYFREGHHKILIATSVAEEGLDIQECNLVMRYDYTTNEIAMVQARGRARADKSKYILVASDGEGIAEKEKLNAIREVMMEQAISELQTEIEQNSEDFLQLIHELQKQSKLERDVTGQPLGAAGFVDGDFQLRCFNCDEFACFNSDLRKFESTHHAVISEDFVDSCSVSLHREPTQFCEYLAMTGTISCKNCSQGWGIVARYHQNQLCVIKIANFVVKNKEAKYFPKKWMKAPFKVEDLKQSDSKMVSDVSSKITGCIKSSKGW